MFLKLELIFYVPFKKRCHRSIVKMEGENWLKFVTANFKNIQLFIIMFFCLQLMRCDIKYIFEYLSNSHVNQLCIRFRVHF